MIIFSFTLKRVLLSDYQSLLCPPQFVVCFCQSGCYKSTAICFWYRAIPYFDGHIAIEMPVNCYISDVSFIVNHKLWRKEVCGPTRRFFFCCYIYSQPSSLICFRTGRKMTSCTSKENGSRWLLVLWMKGRWCITCDGTRVMMTEKVILSIPSL